MAHAATVQTGDVAEHFEGLFRIGAGRQHLLLGTPHLGCSHGLHRSS